MPKIIISFNFEADIDSDDAEFEAYNLISEVFKIAESDEEVIEKLTSYYGFNNTKVTCKTKSK